MNTNVDISGSLRKKLFKILATLMLAVSVIFIVETFSQAEKIAKDSFDKSLTILTLAIMEQSENYSSDSLSENTLEIIKDSVGDIFYYNINALDGGYVTGYSDRPESDTILNSDIAGKPILFNGFYKGTPVRASFYKVYADNSNYKGWIELTVWQFLDQRLALQQHIFTRSLLRLFILILTTFLVLWFGINYGLKPLTQLQRSLSKRSINDLSPITTAVPLEVSSLVMSMNELLARIKTAIVRREAFLGNASHQLKTPLARIQGEANLGLRSQEPQQHIKNIHALTKHTSRLTNQMLSLLRAESDDLLLKKRQDIDLNELTREVAEHFAPDITRQNRELIFQASDETLIIKALPIMLTEAISNLVENAIAYSHTEQAITIVTSRSSQWAEIKVIDNGPGIPLDKQEDALRRFYRIPGNSADGCGLGLPIVEEIAASFNGELFFEGPVDKNKNTAFTVGLRFPLSYQH